MQTQKKIFSPPRNVLLSPGPVNTSLGVKEALIYPEICHRGQAFSELLHRVSTKLRNIFRGNPDYSLLLLTASGTSAGESALASCVPPNKKILILDNGSFGLRLAEIATTHKMRVIHLRYAFGQQIPLKEVRRTLAQDPDIAVVTMVHHETSVGILNPIGEVGKICREYDCLFLVDAISSLGGEDLDVVRDEIDVCWSTGCKCLHGISGISFLCVSPRVWPRIAPIQPRIYSLDLKRYQQYAKELGQTPFTPAVANIFALEKACDEYLEQGGLARQQMYKERNQRLREGLRRLGIDFFSEGGCESHSIVTTQLPAGIPFSLLDEKLRSFGFVVYDCKPPLQGRYFQIGNMGDLSNSDLDRFIDSMGKIIEESSYGEYLVQAK